MQAIQEREDGQGEAGRSVRFCGEEVQDPAPVPLLWQPERQCQVGAFLCSSSGLLLYNDLEVMVGQGTFSQGKAAGMAHSCKQNASRDGVLTNFGVEESRGLYVHLGASY